MTHELSSKRLENSRQFRDLPPLVFRSRLPSFEPFRFLLCQVRQKPHPAESVAQRERQFAMTDRELGHVTSVDLRGESPEHVSQGAEALGASSLATNQRGFCGVFSDPIADVLEPNHARKHEAGSDVRGVSLGLGTVICISRPKAVSDERRGHGCSAKEHINDHANSCYPVSSSSGPEAALTGEEKSACEEPRYSGDNQPDALALQFVIGGCHA